ncbi:DUF6314 family protein [Pseudarthrobacter sp. J1763]|uniref:DUF6314 family protein n=1 Tax=Pseudarthrobacter sp. J1763 TaxID=3420445 RepID=UPI003D294AFC
MTNLSDWLLGEWTLSRELWDRTSGTHGEFTGVAHYTPLPHGGLRYRENGTLRWAGHSSPAFREYLLYPCEDSSALDMFFTDGKPFHRMSFKFGQEQAEHLCVNDLYRVNYERMDEDSFRFRWDVTGPSKLLRLDSVLHRRLNR